jgi:hypothetical protein
MSPQRHRRELCLSKNPLTQPLPLEPGVEDIPQRCRVLWGLFSFHVVRAELQTARQLGEELLTLAQPLQDPVYLQGAHFALVLQL